jgi:hypothetical protein
MAWKKFTRTRNIDRETPMVTLNKIHCYYNAVAGRMFELKEGKRVIYHIDETNRKIGNVRSRLNESGRDEWEFDKIEYSVVSAEAQQYEWESFWIDRFKEGNNGILPSYNRIAGRVI